MARAWNSWFENWEKVTGGRRVIKHMMNGRLSKGWNAWVEETALQTWKMQMLLKTTAFLRNSKLPAGWNTWLELVQEREVQRRGPGVLHAPRAGARFLGWHAQWWDAERNREVMLYAWSHMCNRELSTALNAWAEMIEMRAEFMQLVRKGSASSSTATSPSASAAGAPAGRWRLLAGARLSGT